MRLGYSLRLILLVALGFVSSGYAASSEATSSDSFMVVLVHAPHLDYSSGRALVQSMRARANPQLREEEAGHAWVYLRGIHNGEVVEWEGGHTGAFGEIAPIPGVGVKNLIQYGYVDPTPEQKLSPRHEPNPAKYMWVTYHDGMFQPDSGAHPATFAARYDLSPEQFARVLDYAMNYDYSSYCIIDHQCAAFVGEIVQVAGHYLEHEVSVPIEKSVKILGHHVQLWEDPQYSILTFSSPDVLERSLKQAVWQGEARPALSWYQHRMRARRYL